MPSSSKAPEGAGAGHATRLQAQMRPVLGTAPAGVCLRQARSAAPHALPAAEWLSLHQSELAAMAWALAASQSPHLHRRRLSTAAFSVARPACTGL